MDRRWVGGVDDRVLADVAGSFATEKGSLSANLEGAGGGATLIELRGRSYSRRMRGLALGPAVATERRWLSRNRPRGRKTARVAAEIARDAGSARQQRRGERRSSVSAVQMLSYPMEARDPSHLTFWRLARALANRSEKPHQIRLASLPPPFGPAHLALGSSRVTTLHTCTSLLDNI